MSRDKEFDGDAGAPLPDFSTNIQLQTVAPALGGHSNKPDYLEYDQKGRGVVTTMFANTGAAYMMGIAGGGFYGLRTGLQSTPSSRFKVKLNSVLNHCGRYGSRAGNSLGVFAVMYSLYEGLADQVSTLKKGNGLLGLDGIRWRWESTSFESLTTNGSSFLLRVSCYQFRQCPYLSLIFFFLHYLFVCQT